MLDLDEEIRRVDHPVEPAPAAPEPTYDVNPATEDVMDSDTHQPLAEGYFRFTHDELRPSPPLPQTGVAQMSAHAPVVNDAQSGDTTGIASFAIRPFLPYADEYDDSDEWSSSEASSDAGADESDDGFDGDMPDMSRPEDRLARESRARALIIARAHAEIHLPAAVHADAALVGAAPNGPPPTSASLSLGH